MKKLLFTFIFVLVIISQAAAQNTTDSIKVLRDDRSRVLLKGDDFDRMGLVAEVNQFPRPEKVLKWKKELALTPDQVKKLTDIVAHMHKRVVQSNDSMLRNEKMIDSLFKMKQIDDGTIIFYTNRYGLYCGELRDAVLQACLATRQVLTAVQLGKYISMEKSS